MSIPRILLLCIAVAGAAAITSCGEPDGEIRTGHAPDSPETAETDSARFHLSADELLERFPESIPGASRVDIFPVENSRYVLIHVRDAHLYDSEQTQDRIIKVHDEIYSILYHLILKLGVRTAYLEGLTGERVAFLNDAEHAVYSAAGRPGHVDRQYLDKRNLDACHRFVRLADIRLRRLARAAESLDGQDRERIHSIIRSVVADRAMAQDFLAGIRTNPSVLRLLNEGLMQFRVAEDDSLYAQAETLFMKKHKGDDVDIATNLFYDAREDALLEILAGQDRPLCLVTYGAAHAWGGPGSCGEDYSLEHRYSQRDNIGDWNRRNPGRSFSLIEVTPRSLEGGFRTETETSGIPGG